MKDHLSNQYNKNVNTKAKAKKYFRGINFTLISVSTVVMPCKAAFSKSSLKRCLRLQEPADSCRREQETADGRLSLYILGTDQGWPKHSHNHNCPKKCQQLPRVTSIGSLPPKTLGKSRGPPQNPTEPRRALGETPAEPSERPRRAL